MAPSLQPSLSAPRSQLLALSCAPCFEPGLRTGEVTIDRCVTPSGELWADIVARDAVVAAESEDAAAVEELADEIAVLRVEERLTPSCCSLS